MSVFDLELGGWLVGWFGGWLDHSCRAVRSARFLFVRPVSLTPRVSICFVTSLCVGIHKFQSKVPDRMMVGLPRRLHNKGRYRLPISNIE